MNILRYHKQEEISQYINGLIYTYKQQADWLKVATDKQTK